MSIRSPSTPQNSMRKNKLGAPDQGILIVKLPKGMTIKKDVAVQIPLILETADGTKASVIATVGKTKTGAPQSTEQKEDK